MPLVVDMESALFITGLVIEALLALARHAPMKALLACLNLFGGYRRFRESLLATAGFEVATLPENTKLVELLQAQASTGRPILLRTRTGANITKPVLKRYAFFTGGQEGLSTARGRSRLAILRNSAASAPSTRPQSVQSKPMTAT